MSPKTELSAYEKVMAYVASRHDGVDQHVIAKLYGVNVGRVSEAITSIEYAVANVREVYGLARAAKEESGA